MEFEHQDRVQSGQPILGIDADQHHTRLVDIASAKEQPEQPGWKESPAGALQSLIHVGNRHHARDHPIGGFGADRDPRIEDRFHFMGEARKFGWRRRCESPVVLPRRGVQLAKTRRLAIEFGHPEGANRHAESLS